MQITTIGLDLAKHVFQVHGVDANDAVVEKRRLRRGQVLGYFAKLAPCRVGLEACATAHFWARELRRLGHEVRLIPPQYVKAYLKRGKNDAADAAAICEAARRPSMRFVPIKSEEQQAVLVMHRAPASGRSSPRLSPPRSRTRPLSAAGASFSSIDSTTAWAGGSR